MNGRAIACRQIACINDVFNANRNAVQRAARRFGIAFCRFRQCFFRLNGFPCPDIAIPRFYPGKGGFDSGDGGGFALSNASREGQSVL